MKYLSLFSGVGGGDLGCQHLLGWNCVGYVESNEYCQKVLKQRITDGFLDPAPIFGDIRDFISEGYAEAYQGMVDVLSAGPPCQPWSAAGKEKGEIDSRNLWPETIKIISIVRPKYVFLENVARLVSKSYWGTILGSMASRGYGGKYAIFPAYIAGAPQNGARVWLVFSSDSKRLEGIHKTSREKYLQPIKITLPKQFWKAHPAVFRRGDGIPNRVERTKAIGNGQVPGMVELAWKVLSGECK